jgi:hypothetical protein
MSMEPDVPAHFDDVLKDRLQNTSKEDTIEIYYELLSSGHSVGEILTTVGGIQSKSAHDDTVTPEDPQSRFDAVATEVTFKHEIEAGVLTAERAQYQRELDAAVKSSVATALAKATETAARREASLQAEAAEEKERNRKLLAQLEEMTAELQALRRKQEERNLTYKQQLAAEKERIHSEMPKNAEAEHVLETQRKDRSFAAALEVAQERERRYKEQLAAAEDRIRAEARKKADDEYALKLHEKDKQLADAWQKVREAEAKLQQGLPQVQDKVPELDLEEILRDAFRDDEISEVKRGQNGAEIVEKVVDRRGRRCGTILWETKNGKWQKVWLAKLRNDQREFKAELAVLVAAQPPGNIQTFAHREGIWIAHQHSARDLASLLRFSLIMVFAERANQAGKDENTEVLYGYLTSIEFQHRIQAIVEGFSNLLAGIEQEKRQFMVKWAQQEKELRQIIDNTTGMYGDLQAVTDCSLPSIAALEMPEIIGSSQPQDAAFLSRLHRIRQ